MTTKKEMSIYVHIPFCVKKCLYCDFLSAPASDTIQHAYVQALLQQIQEQAGEYNDYRVPSIFIGGGTPSVLPAEDIAAILHGLHRSFQVDGDAEITIEVNPGTLTEKQAWLYQQAGINRISIGVQSTHNTELAELGRIHTYEDVLQTLSMVRMTGIENVNLDIMSALPGQTLSAYRTTLERIVQLHPTHISSYSLIIEEGTPYYDRYAVMGTNSSHQYPSLPEEDTDRTMYELTKTILLEAGYERYEISNYAQKGQRCRHNIRYWERENYLGLGIGAASLMENVRWSQTRDLSLYLQGNYARCEQENLTRQAQMEEFMFLGLRMMCGIQTKKFDALFGVSYDSVYGALTARMVKQQLLNRSLEGQIQLTDRGIDLSNSVLSEFLL
ncbi:MAG: radical SAM family heme chaperone HemW [Lachnospiraceae bacterium]